MAKRSKPNSDTPTQNQPIPFPVFQATTLAGSQITLPEQARGKITLILIAFQRHAQSMIDSWLSPYLEEFMENPKFTFYEIPMIESSWWRLFATSIDRGMRQGIPSARHQHVVTFYGNAAVYINKLGMSDRSQAYAFLLDTHGVIQWRGKGFATPGKAREMVSLAYQYLHDSDD